MANADDLGRLAQEMANAYEDRIQSISNIKRDTADFLAETREEIRDREIKTKNMLAEFNDAREEMGRKLRAELAKFKSDLDAAEGDRKNADQAEIKEREAYIGDLLADFDRAHQEMADNLRAELAKVKPELAAAEGDRKNADQAEIKKREAYIGDLLADFDRAHQEMADNLRAELAKVKPELAAAEGDRKNADQAEIKERKNAVSAMLDEFRKEQEEAAAAWKELITGMQSLREKATITGAVEVEAAVEVATVEEAIEEEEPEEKDAEEEVAEEEVAEEEEEESEKEGLEDRIIGILEDQPDGLRMVEIAGILGIESWRSLIPVMRVLLDDGEVRKEDSTYFIA